MSQDPAVPREPPLGEDCESLGENKEAETPGEWVGFGCVIGQ